MPSRPSSWLTGKWAAAETVREAGVLDKTAFFITSDHGQVDGSVTAKEAVRGFGTVRVDCIPNPGSRTVTLLNPTDKQLQHGGSAAAL